MRPCSSRGPRTLVRIGAVAVAALATVTAGAAFAALPPGADTSHYQHNPSLNWAAVKASGVKFAFLKATEGTTFVDPYYAADAAATAKLGIFHGAYHFARPDRSAVAQADFFSRVIGNQQTPGTLPPVLDLENTGGLSNAHLIQWTQEWLTEVTRKTGRNPMIYVSPAFWEEHLNDSTAFHDYPLWVAHYHVAAPRVPGGWPTWSFWQTTSTGRISGISGNVDEDVFNGSMTNLKKFALDFDPSPTALTLAASNLAPAPGGNVTFSGTLKTTTGKPIAGRRVHVSDKIPGSPWTRIGTTRSTSTGGYSITLPISAAGRYRTHFKGGPDYLGTTATPLALTLTYQPTTLSLTTSTTKALVGTTVKLRGTLKQRNAKPLAKRAVTVSQRVTGSKTWKVVAHATTNSKGAFDVASTLAHSGAYRAAFAGDGTYASAVSPGEPVTATLNPTSVTLEPRRSAQFLDHHVRMRGVLRNGTKRVADRTVLVQRRMQGGSVWSTVATARTDSQGAYVTRALISGPASYRASFDGDSVYATSASASRTVTVTPPMPSRLSLAGASTREIHQGRAVSLSGRLTSKAGDPLTSRDVHVWKRLTGTSTWYRVEGTTTSSHGDWRLRVQPTKSAWFRAVFHGTTTYAAAHSPRARVKVLAP